MDWPRVKSPMTITIETISKNHINVLDGDLFIGDLKPKCSSDFISSTTLVGCFRHLSPNDRTRVSTFNTPWFCSDAAKRLT